MTAETLLQSLEKVRQTAPGRWVARCPAHTDKGPSLSVRETDDGKVLVHCFAGCSTHEIVSAVGMTVDQLFPPREVQDQHFKPIRQPFSAADSLRCVFHEGLLIAAVGRKMLSGEWDEKSQERLTLAVGRVGAAMTISGVSP